MKTIAGLQIEKLVRAKSILEKKNSARVTIIQENVVIYEDKLPRGLTAALFLFDIQKTAENLQKFLTDLNLNENLLKNQNAKHGVKSASFNAHEKREVGISRTLSPQFPPFGRKEKVQTLG